MKIEHSKPKINVFETKEEEVNRKEKERKEKVELLNEKMHFGGVMPWGTKLGPGKRDRMLRMGNVNSSNNHATWMEELGANAAALQASTSKL